ncbi:MAG: radical SAM protein [Verrucomicrobia bacterium]|nr:radical SAM protein [Verrucomicrobiota bacterium]
MATTAANKAAKILSEAVIGYAAKQPERLFLQIRGNERPRQQARNCGGRPQQWPQCFVVRLTGRCNLACAYCFDAANGSRRQDLDVATARQIADYILRTPGSKPVISFFGGEPLVNWETGRFLIETLRREGRANGKIPYFNVITNGTLITPPLARELASDDITVQISIDGPRKHHDRHRRDPSGAGSHQAALRGLELLRAASPKAKVDAQAVLTPGNTDLIGIAKHLKAVGFRRIKFLHLTDDEGGGEAWSAAAVRRLIREHEKFYVYYLQSVINGHPEVDMGFAHLIASQPEGPHGLCTCGSDEILIDARGDIYPCPKLYGQSAVPALGNCATSDPSAPPNISRPTQPLDSECAQCWAYEWCGGGCSFQCQKCALTPSSHSSVTQKLWCDLMRARFARAAITYRLLRRSFPKCLESIQRLFSDVTLG